MCPPKVTTPKEKKVEDYNFAEFSEVNPLYDTATKIEIEKNCEKIEIVGDEIENFGMEMNVKMTEKLEAFQNTPFEYKTDEFLKSLQDKLAELENVNKKLGLTKLGPLENIVEEALQEGDTCPLCKKDVAEPETDMPTETNYRGKKRIYQPNYFKFGISQKMCDMINDFEMFRQKKDNFFQNCDTKLMDEYVKFSLKEKDKILKAQEDLLVFNENLENYQKQLQKRMLWLHQRLIKLAAIIDGYVKCAFIGLKDARKRERNKKIGGQLKYSTPQNNKGGEEEFDYDACLDVIYRKENPNWETKPKPIPESVKQAPNTIAVGKKKQFDGNFEKKRNNKELQNILDTGCVPDEEPSQQNISPRKPPMRMASNVVDGTLKSQLVPDNSNKSITNVAQPRLGSISPKKPPIRMTTSNVRDGFQSSQLIYGNSNNSIAITPSRMANSKDPTPRGNKNGASQFSQNNGLNPNNVHCANRDSIIRDIDNSQDKKRDSVMSNIQNSQCIGGEINNNRQSIILNSSVDNNRINIDMIGKPCDNKETLGVSNNLRNFAHHSSNNIPSSIDGSSLINYANDDEERILEERSRCEESPVKRFRIKTPQNESSLMNRKEMLNTNKSRTMNYSQCDLDRSTTPLRKNKNGIPLSTKPANIMNILNNKKRFESHNEIPDPNRPQANLRDHEDRTISYDQKRHQENVPQIKGILPYIRPSSKDHRNISRNIPEKNSLRRPSIDQEDIGIGGNSHVGYQRPDDYKQLKVNANDPGCRSVDQNESPLKINRGRNEYLITEGNDNSNNQGKDEYSVFLENQKKYNMKEGNNPVGSGCFGYGKTAVS